jgi:hypothetical protein
MSEALACFEPDIVHMLRRKVMSEMHELADTEVETVCGGVSDLAARSDQPHLTGCRALFRIL